MPREAIPARARRRPRAPIVPSVRPAALLLACCLVSGCRFVSTPISRVLAHPHRYQGTEITVAGRVEAVRRVEEIGAAGFRLVDRGDSLLVLTLEPPPEVGRRVRLQGHFIRNFPLDDRERPVLLYKTGGNGGRVSSTVDVR